MGIEDTIYTIAIINDVLNMVRGDVKEAEPFDSGVGNNTGKLGFSMSKTKEITTMIAHDIHHAYTMGTQQIQLLGEINPTSSTAYVQILNRLRNNALEAFYERFDVNPHYQDHLKNAQLTRTVVASAIEDQLSLLGCYELLKIYSPALHKTCEEDQFDNNIRELAKDLQVPILYHEDLIEPARRFATK